MDAQHLQNVQIDRTQLREIPRRQWVAAAPSRLLNGGLALGWIAYLWSVGFIGALIGSGASDAPVPQLSTIEEVILLALVVSLMGVLATVVAAIANNPLAPRMSALSAVSIVAILTTCGFAGHSISSWGPGAAGPAALGIASFMIMSRRAA